MESKLRSSLLRSHWLLTIGCGTLLVLLAVFVRTKWERSAKEVTTHAQVSLSLASLSAVTKEALSDDPNAELELANRYFQGTGGAYRDFGSAAAWYWKAALLGNPDAEDRLADMYQNRLISANDDEALGWYIKAAAQGNRDAENSLGNRYQLGEGVMRNYTEAVFLYRKSASQGNANAENNLGWMYQNGLGISKDYLKAFSCYQNAATQGDLSAKNNIGWMYQNGFGVKQNYQLALSWYQKAAAQGNGAAKQNLANLQQQAASQPQGTQSQTGGVGGAAYYTGNKAPDSQCTNWTPNAAEMSFHITASPDTTGEGPESVTFSMTNSSGCVVDIRAVGKATGTQQHVFTTATTPGQPTSLDFKGLSDEKTLIPFTNVLPPNTQEYPSTAEIYDIEACSDTPPANFPASTYFDPFRNGRCASLASVGPVSLPQPAGSCPAGPAPWFNTTTNGTESDGSSTYTNQQVIQETNGGLQVSDTGSETMVTSGGVPIAPQTSTTQISISIPFNNIGDVEILGTGLQLIARSQDFQATLNGYPNNGWRQNLNFPTVSDAQAAAAYLKCHAGLH